MIAGVLELQWQTDMVRLSNEMRRAQGVIGNTMGSIERSIAGAQRALAGLGVGLSVGAFASMVKGAIDAADNLNDLSKKTNITVENLAGLQLAARQSGTDLESVAQAVSKLSQNMGKDAEAFATLGISTKDPLQALKDLSDVFVALEDPQTRAAVMAQALGKSWMATAPLLAEGSAKIEEMIQKGTRLSGVDQKLAEQADALNDKWAELVGTGGMMNRIIAPLLPLFNTLADQMLEARRQSDGLQMSFDPLTETIRALVVLGGNFAYVFRTMGIAIAGMAAQADGFSRGGIKGFLREREMVKGILDAERKSFDEWEKAVMSAKGGALGGGGGSALDSEDAALGAASRERKAALVAARAAGFLKHEKNSVSDTDSAYRNLLRTLKEKLATDEKLGEVGRLQLQFEAMNAKTLATFTEARRAELFDLAKKIDLKNAEKEATERYIKAFQAEQDQRDQERRELAEYEAGKSKTLLDFNDRIQQAKAENELLTMNSEQRELAIFIRDMETAGIQRGTAAWEQYAIAYKQALSERATIQAAIESHKGAAGEVSEFWLEAARSMQRNFSDFFFDVMQGDLSKLGASFKRTLDRMVADQLAANAAMQLFGPGFAKGGNGQLGGMLGGILGTGGGGVQVVDRSGAASAADIARLGMSGGGGGGGGILSGAVSWLRGLIPFETGTPFVPSDGPYMLHRGERVVTAADNARGGSQPVNLTINYSGGVPVDRRTQEQNAAVLMRQAQRAVSRNTA